MDDALNGAAQNGPDLKFVATPILAGLGWYSYVAETRFA
jgi:hypothetical protein